MWLKNVARFFERFDNQAKDVADEKITQISNKKKGGSSCNKISGDNVAIILVAHGISEHEYVEYNDNDK
jgi:hypothetical protein